MTTVDEKQHEHRLIWSVTRSVLESQRYKQRRGGGKHKSHWQFFERLLSVFGLLLKLVGLYHRGFLHATHILVREVELNYPDLPPAFHNYRILHLTDLHLDGMPGLEKLIVKTIEGLNYDLCVFTGDYRKQTHGPFSQIKEPMQLIVSGINAPDGILATLGNHDTFMMVDLLREMGIKVLANESHRVERNGQYLTVTGVDDPHYYFTDQAYQCIEGKHQGFPVALVHSPELFDLAAVNGYKLYLCGHTHGGQICLPGGIPVIRHLYNGKKYYRGLWQYNGMKGYTSEGCGTSGIPIRYNSHSEVTLFTLKQR